MPFQKEMPHRLIKPSWDLALTAKNPEARHFRMIERQIHCVCLNIICHLISFDCSFSREKDFLPEQLRMACKDGFGSWFLSMQYALWDRQTDQSQRHPDIRWKGYNNWGGQRRLSPCQIFPLETRKIMLEWKIIGKFIFRALHQLPCRTDFNCHTTTMVITNAARNSIETNVAVNIRIL